MIAIIPARAGSKGLAGKNIRDLKGKPLIAYTIEAAIQSPSIDCVIVSTDNIEIANIAKQYGAQVPFLRPNDLAADNSLAIDVYLHALDFLESEGNSVNELIILLPTTPLRNSYDIEAAIELYNKNNADSVISFTRESHPVTWHRYIKDDGKIEFDSSMVFLSNRQSLRPTFYPNGAIYIIKKELLYKRTYYSEKTYAYIMPPNRSVDIDTIEDFEYAEYLIKKNEL